MRKEHPRPKTKWGWHLVSFSPDGKRYAAHFGHFAGLYDTATGFEPVRLDGQDEGIPGWIQGVTGKQLAWSPDGKRLAAVGIQFGGLPGGPSGKMGLAVWDPETGKRLNSIEPAFDDGPRAAAFSPDGKTLAIGYKKNVWLYNPLKETKKLADTPGPVTALAYSPDGKMLAVGFRKPAGDAHRSEVQVLDAETGKELKRFDGFEGVDHTGPTKLPVSALAFSPDGKTLIAGTGFLPMEALPKDAPKSGEVKVWNLEGPPQPAAAAEPWREKGVLKGQTNPVTSVAFAPDGKTFVTAGMELTEAEVGGQSGVSGEVVLWDGEKRQPIWSTYYNLNRTEFGHRFAAAFSPDGKQVAITTSRGIDVRDAATGKLVSGGFQEKGIDPAAVAFGPMEQVQGITLHRLAFTDGRTLVAKTWLDGGEPGTAEFGPLANPPKIEGLPPAGVAYSPDGKQLVFIPNNKIDPDWASGKSKEPRPDPNKATHWFAQVWGGGSGAAMQILPHGTDPVTAVAWDPKGKFIATGGADGVVILWDAKKFTEVRRVKLGGRGGKSTINALAFSPDGQTLAAAREFDQGKNPRRVALIETATGKIAQDLQFFSNAPLAVAFSPDGKTLVVGCGYRDAGLRKFTPEERKKAGEVRIFATGE